MRFFQNWVNLYESCENFGFIHFRIGTVTGKEVCNGGVACIDGGWQAMPSITKFLKKWALKTGCVYMLIMLRQKKFRTLNVEHQNHIATKRTKKYFYKGSNLNLQSSKC